jgi:hypothetical protein
MFYDPSLALPSPPDDFVPWVAWSAKFRATMDAKIAEPIRSRDAADQHARYQVREMLTKEMERSLRTLVTQYHRLHVTGLVNVSQLIEPSETEKAQAKHILDKQPELYRIARKIADIRGYLRHLDWLDNRDGFSSAPRKPEGNASPGLAVSGNQRGATSFFPAGLR